MKEILLYILMRKWIKENPEPLWRKGTVIQGLDEGSRENRARKMLYFQWENNHANWVRELEEYLGIYKGF